MALTLTHNLLNFPKGNPPSKFEDKILFQTNIKTLFIKNYLKLGFKKQKQNRNIEFVLQNII